MDSSAKAKVQFWDGFAKFEAAFDGEKAKVFIRCPGRVNLIGEHIDYNGFGVLPMAIDQEISALLKINEKSHQIRLKNVDEDYDDFEFSSSDFQIASTKPKWFNYFQCGIKGIIENFDGKVRGFDALVRGTVPPSAGLSSSSALVVCGALCALQALETVPQLTDEIRAKVANICASSERYIGTQGGGMDQAICLLAKRSMAKHIQFNPLRVEDVALPDGATFFVCHSLTELNKAATSHFNERVAECRVATALLAKLLNIPSAKTMSDLAAARPAEDFVGLTKKWLTEDVYDREALLRLLDIDDTTFASRFLNANTKEMNHFKLRQRAEHVFSEAARVVEFGRRCAKSDSAAVVEQLAELMNASHLSCARDYECSCPQLDSLVDACRRAGALGCRLTGAGWGGCTVSLVAAENAHQFAQKLFDDHYKLLGESVGFAYEMSDVIFETKPADGASVIRLE